MSHTVIKVEGLGKQYRLGLVGTGTLSHDLNRSWYKLRGKEDPYLKVGEVNDRSVKGDSDLVWALKDINFEVRQGEVLGIIGRNGAGKSTLLKILSQITSPSVGEIKIKGRIAALLEVGTGFHPELTGRENVFLNGAILGMTKLEIKNKLDEIVAFSGVEKYIDTPVKRYSSGMTVRLGFAVAAHLEPEILIVDEVLAVGDAEFQKKCIGKMKDVSGQGRTVLFVSHNMASVKSLCNRGLVLENGKVSMNGTIDDCVSYYITGSNKNQVLDFKVFKNEVLTPDIEILSIGVKAMDKNYGEPISMDDPIVLIVRCKKKNLNSRFDINIQVKSSQGDYLFSNSSSSFSFPTLTDESGEYEYLLKIPANFFNAETFYLNLLVVKDYKEVVLRENDIISFAVINKKEESGSWMGKSRGPLKPLFDWEFKKVN